jgi:hypothetical protein
LPPPKGLELPPLVPMFPNKLGLPLVVGALKGFDPPLGVVLLNSPPAPPPDDVVAVLPNTLPLPEVFDGAVGNKLPLCPPLVPCGLKLKLLAISPKRSAEICGFLPVSHSFFGTDVLARSQSFFACRKLSCSDGASMGGWVPGVCRPRLSLLSRSLSDAGLWWKAVWFMWLNAAMSWVLSAFLRLRPLLVVVDCACWVRSLSCRSNTFILDTPYPDPRSSDRAESESPYSRTSFDIICSRPRLQMMLQICVSFDRKEGRAIGWCLGMGMGELLEKT